MRDVTVSEAATRVYQLCVVGSGPAGAALALDMAGRGYRVLLIDAGGRMPRPGPGAQRSAPAAHAALCDTKCQAFGGTSWLWGGRIMPMVGPELAHADWPLQADSFAPYLDAAARFLGGDALGRAFAETDKETFFDLDACEMIGREGPLPRRQKALFDAARALDVLLLTEIVGLIYDDQSRCTGLSARPIEGDAITAIRADVTIVAAGGIETARLLLADQARHPHLLGHLQMLGRGYSGHLTGSIARITFAPDFDSAVFGWRQRPGGAFTRRVFRSTATAMAEGIAMFFWAKNLPADDASHGSAILSAKSLISRLRKPLRSRGPGQRAPVRHASIRRHLRNLLVDLPGGLWALPNVLRAQFNPARRRFDHLIPNRARSYRLCYHAQQNRRFHNRITLTQPPTDDALPDIQITYDFDDADIDAVLRAHYHLTAEIESSGMARVTLDGNDADTLRQAIRATARDGYHQIGTAAMGHDASDSVVDADCKMHGITGLYLAGSSVFRSSGAPPPTQTIVALALRLAQHLSQAVLAQPTGDS